MEKLVLKYGYRIPELITRALAGDGYAIAILALMGIGAASQYFKDK